MPSYKYKQIKKIIIECGCSFVRQGKGSHEIWYSERAKHNFSVPLHTTDIKPGTLSAILRQAGISKKEMRQILHS